MSGPVIELLRPLWLPLAVAGAAVVVLVLDSLLPMTDSPQRRGRSLGILSCLALAVLFDLTFVFASEGELAGGVWKADAFSLFVQRLVLGAAVIGALGSLDDVAAKMPRRQGEFYVLLLLATTGMLLLPGARDLIVLILAFELMSLPLYVLAAYARLDGAQREVGRHAAEAGLKLYLVGATSTAITLFGTALLVGVTGTTSLAQLGAFDAAASPLALAGLLFVLGGMGYKLGMVPFHMWVPDTYQGAPTPFVAFLSVAPKVAGVAALSTLFLLALGAHAATWRPALALGAVLTMAVGNLLALPQTDSRRMLAYSGIAQMGYVLVALCAGDAYALGMVLFFLAAYVVTNMGAFLVVHAVAEGGAGHETSALFGLFRRAPVLALGLLLFLLSLAGIPFVAGFWAKLYIFLAAWRAGQYALVVAGVTLAAIGLFYYLRLARAAYMVDPGELPPARAGTALRIAIGLCFAGVLLFGLWPGPLVDSALAAGQALLGAR